MGTQIHIFIHAQHTLNTCCCCLHSYFVSIYILRPNPDQYTTTTSESRTSLNMAMPEGVAGTNSSKYFRHDFSSKTNYLYTSCLRIFLLIGLYFHLESIVY